MLTASKLMEWLSHFGKGRLEQGAGRQGDLVAKAQVFCLRWRLVCQGGLWMHRLTGV